MKGLTPGLVSNLEEVLSKKKNNNANNEEDNTTNESTEPSTSDSVDDTDSSKPIVLVTNGDGIDSPGLAFLVEALVREGLYNVHVLAPQLDKSVSGHSVTLKETIAMNPAEIKGAKAYEVSGTPVDSVSLAFSGALFSWSKPAMVISGINRGSSCGHHMKKDERQENDFKDAVTVCLPLINAAMKDIEKGTFPKSCSLNIEIPTAPLSNKGVKFTKQSTWRSTPSWLAVSANRNPSAGPHRVIGDRNKRSCIRMGFYIYSFTYRDRNKRSCIRMGFCYYCSNWGSTKLNRINISDFVYSFQLIL